jgi:tetratricopeptide (TPR) repeat protein
MAAANEASRVASDIDLPFTAAETLMTIGKVRFELREFDLAEATYKQAKEAYQSIGNVYGQIAALNALTRLYSRMEKSDLEIGAARLAWKMASELGDTAQMRMARSELACALSDCGIHTEAIQHMESVVAEAPFDATAACMFSHILLQAGNYDRSLEESRRTLALDPAESVAILNLGHAYLGKGVSDDAELEYRCAIKERKGGENFIETLRSIRKMLSKEPDLPRGREMLQLFEEEQRKLEVEEKSIDAAGSS